MALLHCFFRERGREKNIDVTQKHQLVSSCMYPAWGFFMPGPGMKLQLGMFPDWKSNSQPLSYETTLQPIEPHWPGLK